MEGELSSVLRKGVEDDGHARIGCLFTMVRAGREFVKGMSMLGEGGLLELRK